MAHTDAPDVKHEGGDENVAGVTRLLVITIAFLAVSFLLMTWMYSSFKASGEAADVKGDAIAQRTADRKPPLPNLQTTPATDLKAFRAAEAQVLETYAWVDQANGVVRMPIAAAIAHVAAHGLPKPAPAPAAAPTTASSPAAATTPASTAAAAK